MERGGRAWQGEDEAEQELFAKYMPERAPVPAYLKPTKLSPTASAVRDLARVLHLDWKEEDGITSDILSFAWETVQRFSTQIKPGEDRSLALSYEQFKECAGSIKCVTDKLDSCLTSAVFFALTREQQSGQCSLSSHKFFDFIMRKVNLGQLRLILAMHDEEGDGYLTEKELQAFIASQMPSMPSLGALDDSFHETYLIYASRKFMFFLDHKHLGKVKITELMLSDILDEFSMLRDENPAPKRLANNWFSVGFVARVQRIYSTMDQDANGLLSRNELSNFSNGSINPSMVDRIFAECRTYSGELDYKSFLDLMLAREYPTQKAVGSN
eukprot:m.164225 g.164225  ORF g.164225 m.164225 type:complete len:327 (-) comp14398_c0_seq8:1048-2028(-)